MPVSLEPPRKGASRKEDAGGGEPAACGVTGTGSRGGSPPTHEQQAQSEGAPPADPCTSVLVQCS